MFSRIILSVVGTVINIVLLTTRINYVTIVLSECTILQLFYTDADARKRVDNRQVKTSARSTTASEILYRMERAERGRSGREINSNNGCQHTVRRAQAAHHAREGYNRRVYQRVRRAAPPATTGGGAQIRPVGTVAPLLRQADGWATMCAAIRPTYEAFVINSEESSHLPGMSSTTPTVLYLSNYDISNILNGLLVAGMPIIMRRVVVDNNSTDFTAPALPPVLPINFETNPNVPAGFDGNWGTQSETWN